MFTGIVEGWGTIAKIQTVGRARRLTVTADFALDQTRIGDSIAVNGACFTVVSIHDRRFEADVSPETLQRTTFDTAKTGDRVNLERAMRLSDRIDGHLVSGHVDGIGVITDKKTIDNVYIITVEIDADLTRYLIEKGSVAVDGISLTVNTLDSKGFSVTVIPHTAKLTTIGIKGVGAKVNIETDMIGKYVEQLAFGRSDRLDVSAHKSSISLNFLEKTGFL